MRSFRIGSALGIPIKLDLTFLLILPVFAYFIGREITAASELLNDVFGAGIDIAAISAGSLPWILGFVTAVGLFVGVLAHEFGHAITAMRYGYGIDSITLWFFGGLAALAEMPEDWRQEFAIAVAGPIVSIGVGVVCYGLFLVVPDLLPAFTSEAAFVLGYLALINVVLAGFNMIPAFPMDGGRVLRALLGLRYPFARATQIAAEVGKFFALLLGLLGLVQLNIILMGVAIFVYLAASGEARQVMLKEAFDGITVRDIMTPGPELHVVTPDLPVADLVDRMFAKRHTGYPVVQGQYPVGIVTLSDAREVEPIEREAFRVEDVMSTDLITVAPDASAMDAMDTMQRNGVGRLLVLDHGGRLVGLVSRTDLMTALDVVRSGGSVDRDRPVPEGHAGEPREREEPGWS